MFRFSHQKSGISHTDDQPDVNVAVVDIVSVPRTDRWRVYYRLQELTIPCSCLADGSLRVELQNGTSLLLLRSVVQQFVAPRQEAVNWLERCWTVN